MKYFEDFSVGDSITTRARTVTEADIVNFAGVSGDFFPLHTDEEYAKKTIFGKRIAHGFLVLTIASGLFPLYEVAIVAFYGMDKVRFFNPTFIGGTIHCVLKVLEKEDKGEKGGVVTFQQEVLNQNGPGVCLVLMKVMVAKKD